MSLSRRLLAGLGATGIAATTLLGAAAPASATSCYEFDAVRLTAHDTDESTDEISIKYPDVSHRVDMKQGNEATPRPRLLLLQLRRQPPEVGLGQLLGPDHLGRATVHAGTEQHM